MRRPKLERSGRLIQPFGQSVRARVINPAALEQLRRSDNLSILAKTTKLDVQDDTVGRAALLRSSFVRGRQLLGRLNAEFH